MAKSALTPEERIRALREIVARRGKCSGLPCSSCPLGVYCGSQDLMGKYLESIGPADQDLDDFQMLKLLAEARAHHAANLLAEDEMSRLLG